MPVSIHICRAPWIAAIQRGVTSLDDSGGVHRVLLTLVATVDAERGIDTVAPGSGRTLNGATSRSVRDENAQSDVDVAPQGAVETGDPDMHDGALRHGTNVVQC